MNRISNLLKNDPFRLNILKIVASIEQQDCYVAAGFVRNMVWDHLHGFSSTQLNDIDVIYFDPLDVIGEIQILNELKQRAVNINWQVKNQALMHAQNSDRAYKSIADAMRFWPEKETAIAVNLSKQNSINIIAPFAVETLFAGLISYNPQVDKSIFESRLTSKQWLEKWPKLKLA